MKKQKANFQYGFTLAEILLVLAIIMILAVLSLTTLVSSQQTQVFNNQFEKVFSMINNARSYAISGRGQLDYVDSDNDGVCKSNACSDKGDDYVAPISYGIKLNQDNNRVALFANMHLPEGAEDWKATGFNEGTDFDDGDDIVLDDFFLLESLELEIEPLTTGKTDAVIFYSPLYVDMSFTKLDVGPAPDQDDFVIIRVRETEGAQRCRQIKIHYLTGIPEVEQCPS